jgi:hypothetical protein
VNNASPATPGRCVKDSAYFPQTPRPAKWSWVAERGPLRYQQCLADPVTRAAPEKALPVRFASGCYPSRGNPGGTAWRTDRGGSCPRKVRRRRASEATPADATASNTTTDTPVDGETSADDETSVDTGSPGISRLDKALVVPDDTGFKRSPFVDGAIVCYTPPAENHSTVRDR